MDYQAILFEKFDGIGRVTLNRPALKNPFGPEVRQEFMSLLTEVRDDDSRKGLDPYWGRGRILFGGKYSKHGRPEFTAVGGRRRLKRAQRVIRAMLDFEKPIIAAVNGVAAGAGVSAALACDLVLASDRARFILSFSRIGLVPDLGAFYLLPLRVGVMRAKELMWTADPVEAREAERWGLVNRVVPHERLEEEAFVTGPSFGQGTPSGLCHDQGGLEPVAREPGIALGDGIHHAGGRLCAVRILRRGEGPS